MITIGFSSHQVEALPFMASQMERHQVVVLEEPPSPNFSGMLNSTISIDDYMMELDSGFPEFGRRMCGLLRKLHAGGKLIIQVEPYFERLLQIHELLTSGKTAEEISGRPEFREIYEVPLFPTIQLAQPALFHLWWKRSKTSPGQMLFVSPLESDYGQGLLLRSTVLVSLCMWRPGTYTTLYTATCAKKWTRGKRSR